jgi:hypothetical protein
MNYPATRAEPRGTRSTNIHIVRHKLATRHTYAPGSISAFTDFDETYLHELADGLSGSRRLGSTQGGSGTCEHENWKYR